MTKKALAAIGISVMTVAAVVAGAIRAPKRFPLDSEHAERQPKGPPREFKTKFNPPWHKI